MDHVLPWRYRRFVVAVALVAFAAALRVWPLGVLGTSLAWLTFYPTVMLAALYGGLSVGLLTAGLSSAIVVLLGPALVGQPFIKVPADWLGLAVFLLTCSMISFVAEAMRRAETRALRAREQAEAANRAKSVFLASMSHELRTPLNAILGFSALMRNEPGTTEDQRRTLDIINRSGEHLLALINDVLEMSKVEAGRVTIEDTPTDLGAMVRDVIDLMRVGAGEKGLTLRLDQGSDFPRFVRTDGPKLRQVLLNLVGNAVKYTDAGGVTVRLHAGPTEDPARVILVVEVEDTGVGIAPEDQPSVFEAFVRVGHQGSEGGTGLGLAISRTYVERMGGRIGLASTPGGGSTFRVELPVRLADEAMVRTAFVDGGRVTGIAPGQPAWRILIVEDRLENRLLLQQILAGVGFEVRTAEDGALGIEAFREWQPHFIWMDVRMPVMDGLEATRRIRAMEGGTDVRIAALTASAFEEQRGEILAVGVDDFVRKPYRPAEIFACLERHLGVRFTTEGAAAPTTARRPEDVTPEMMAGLPAEIRAGLIDALVRLDAAQIRDLIDRVAADDPALGTVLASHADRLAYSAMLTAVRAAEEPGEEESA